MCSTITVEPLFECMAKVTEYVRCKLGEYSIGKSAESKIYVALDEILSNIIKFSDASFVTVECNKKRNILYLKFTDDGNCFNPLTYDEADVNLPIEQRKIGGLGIFMVKNSMDCIDYEYVDKKNILTLGLEV